MENQAIIKAVQAQKEFAKTNPLHTYEQRIECLNKLQKVIVDNSQKIQDALKKDLNKCDFEAYVAEIDFVVKEIDFTKKKLKRWMRPKRVKTPMLQWPAKSYIVYEPLGSVLIISPWNYPFQLLFSPLVGAISAGNTAVLKPSEIAEETSKVVTEIVSENFDPKLITVVEGAVEETTCLLEQPFDHIFYTGNGHVARIVMEKAAKNLVPVTLELGGKSPCVVSGDVDIDMAAKRITWAKFFNAGQTCVAPDYILVDKTLKAPLVESMKKWLSEFYGSDPIKSPDYGRIINNRHFDRLKILWEDAKVLIGGQTDDSTNYIAPTVIEANSESKVMKDEIFGPILPIIEVDDFSKAISFINNNDKPLASYLFTGDDHKKQIFTDRVSSGGMLINDALVHLASEHLPFGGVGPSGMGRYHGLHSFETFSHHKSVMMRSFWFDIPLRYPPYEGKLSIIRKLLSLFG